MTPDPVQARRDKVRAAIAGVTGCPAEWISGGMEHACSLLSAVDHQHLCSCGNRAPVIDWPDESETCETGHHGCACNDDECECECHDV